MSDDAVAELVVALLGTTVDTGRPETADLLRAVTLGVGRAAGAGTTPAAPAMPPAPAMPAAQPAAPAEEPDA